VERGEFQIVYQPRFETKSRRMTGCEALLRWVRDGAEIAAPTEFVPLLESSGLMLPIGEWLISSICDQIRAWIDQGLAPVPVAFNASGRQFDDQALPETVRKALERARLPAALLEMEITESTIMHRPDESEAIVRRLRDIGIGIAIDDFGTGYSSLSRLKRFPITALKIDRSFIAGVPGTDDASITRAIITMAHSLNLAVVAEGVETEAQYQFLAAHACDEIQGYHFSAAIDAAKLGELLQRRADGMRPESSGQVVAFAPRHRAGTD
jgi:EAL domain-containing protein (putative c-di-GMP-specific phosphodiesterase class I)